MITAPGHCDGLERGRGYVLTPTEQRGAGVVVERRCYIYRV